MANFVISSGDYIRPLRSPWGAPSPRYLPESTAQSYRVGAVVELDSQVSTSAGKVRTALVSASTVTSTSICGIASEPASSVHNTKVGFFDANPNIEFWARTRFGTIETTCVGEYFGLGFDSTKNVYLVDLGNAVSTSERVYITELLDAAGDSGGAVAFKFGSASTNTFGLQPR